MTLTVGKINLVLSCSARRTLDKRGSNNPFAKEKLMNDEEPIDVLEQEVSHQPQEVQEPTQEAQVQESKQDRNWREMRKKLEYYEQRLEDFEKRQPPAVSRQPQPEEEDVALADDDIVTAKDVKLLAKKMAKELYQQERVKFEAETAEDRLRSKFTDFDDVVGEENVRKLIKDEPELAKVLRATSDPYAKGVAAYRYIRMMDRANPEQVDKQTIRQNLQKPRTTSSLKESGLDHAEEFASGRMTTEMRQKLYEEMRASQGRR